MDAEGKANFTGGRLNSTFTSPSEKATMLREMQLLRELYCNRFAPSASEDKRDALCAEDLKIWKKEAQADPWWTVNGFTTSFKDLSAEQLLDILAYLGAVGQRRMLRTSRFWNSQLTHLISSTDVYIRLQDLPLPNLDERESLLTPFVNRPPHHLTFDRLRQQQLELHDKSHAIVQCCLHPNIQHLVFEMHYADAGFDPRHDCPYTYNLGGYIDYLMRADVRPHVPNLREVTFIGCHCDSDGMGKMYQRFPQLTRINLVHCSVAVTWTLSWPYVRQIRCRPLVVSTGRCQRQLERELLPFVKSHHWTSLSEGKIAAIPYLADWARTELQECLQHWEDGPVVNWHALRPVTQEIVAQIIRDVNVVNVDIGDSDEEVVSDDEESGDDDMAGTDSDGWELEP